MENIFDYIVLENEETTTAVKEQTTEEAVTEEVKEEINIEFKGVEPFLNSFSHMATGMIGIFIVTAILIMFISVLNKFKFKDSNDD